MILDRDGLIRVLVESAGFVGVAAPEAAIPRALGWLTTIWGAGESHLPFTLVHDLGHVLLEGGGVRFASGQSLADWPIEEQAARLAYEDGVLGRWLRDATVDAAQMALAGVAEANRPAAVAHAIGLALAEPLRAVEDLFEGNPAALRGVRDAIVDAIEIANPDAEWRDFVGAQHALAVAAVPPGPLFSLADLWELAHFEAVPSESLRLALRQLHEVRDAVEPPSPGLLGHVQRRAREVPVEQTTADSFPAGGFDGISQRGRFENLVRTEIGYVDVEVLPGVADAFDIRYVLGELLYYTRDDSPLLDAQRQVTVRFDGIDRLRDKHAELPLQTAVLVQGVALALHRDLCAAFGRQAVSVDLRWLETPLSAAADEERSLLATSLAADLAHGRATAEVIESPLGASTGPRIVFSTQAAPGRLGPRTTWVRVDEPTWSIAAAGADIEPVDMRLTSGWRALVDRLLLAAVAAKR